ncbi:MAG: hypothetical protein LBL65_02070 [Campylobacteraceae bacterium]|jgi:TPR repeat protein|nr:hypothetical protein [Campylobacteraceae bacterium]
MKKLLVLICCAGFCFANADIDKLAKDIQDGCDNGKYDDCLQLAMMHDNNPFAPEMRNKNKAAEYYDKGIQLLEKICSNGDAKKCLEIGSFYLDGNRAFGIKKNGDKAHEFFKKGCFDFKNGETCYMAGSIYKTAKDEIKATEFIEKSCELKYPVFLSTPSLYGSALKPSNFFINSNRLDIKTPY